MIASLLFQIDVNSGDNPSLLILTGLAVIAVCAILLLSKSGLNNKVWWIYVTGMILGFVGMVLTRSPMFPLLMFLFTLVYVGAQAVRRLWPKRRSLPSLKTPDSAPWKKSVTVFTALALVLMIISAYAFRPAAPDPMTPPIILMFAGGLVLFIALYFYTRKVENRLAFQITPPVGGWLPAHRGITAIGIACLLIEAEITGNVFNISFLQTISYWIQGLLFWGGVFLTAWGLCGAPKFWVGWRQKITRISTHHVILLAILLFAFGLRIWNLEYTLRTSMDDAVNLSPAFPILHDDTPSVGLVASNDYFIPTTQVFPQMVALSIKLFGYDFAGARAISAFLGTLNILGLYLLASAMFDRKLALVAALVLSTFPPHLHFSRLSFYGLADATAGTLMIAFLVRALKSDRRADWVLAGASFGLTQYFYETGRLFFPMLIAAWFVTLLLFNFRRVIRLWRGIAMFLVTATLVVLPVYYAALARNALLSPRMTVSGTGADYWINLLKSGDTTSILNRVLEPFLAYVHIPETQTYYAGLHPMVLEYFIPFFLMGLFFVLWGRRRYLIILIWVVGAATASLLSQVSVFYPHFMIVFPALALLIAIGIYYTIPMLLSRVEDKRLVMGLVVMIAVVVCVVQGVYYFDDHLPVEKLELWNGMTHPDGTDAAIRAAALPPGTQVFIIMGDKVPDVNTPQTIMTLYRWNKPEPPANLQVMSIEQFTPDFARTLTIDKDYAFFIEPGHNDLVTYLRSMFVFDDPQYSTEPGIPARNAYTLYFAPLEKQHPLLAAQNPDARTNTTFPIPGQPQRCVSVVGEAMSAGYATINVPPAGKWVVHLQPFSHYLGLKLNDIGLSDVVIRDDSAPSGALGPGIQDMTHPDYFQSGFYNQLLQDSCAVTIIMPWIGDLTTPGLSAGTAAPILVGHLVKLLHELSLTNPNGKIYLLNYYPAQANAFMQDVAGGVSQSTIEIYNEKIREACSGQNLNWAKAECVDTSAILTGLNANYVIDSFSQTDLQGDLMPDQSSSPGDIYFSENPGSSLLGDGISLNVAGKRALADYLAPYIKNAFAGQ